MNWFYLSVFIFLVGFNLSHAQSGLKENNDSSKLVNNTHKNAIYLSVGGPAAGLYSLNYERRIGQQLWARAGFTYGLSVLNFLSADEAVSVPLGINKLFGKESKFFEIGLGTTLYFSDIDTTFDLFEDDDSNNNIAPDFNILLTSTFNYRYQPIGENFIFKIGLSPTFITSTGDFFPLLGISIGGAF